MNDKINKVHCSGNGVVYGLGVIGGAIYFISHSLGFWMGVLGFFKSLIWPVYLVYYALDYLLR